MIEVEVTGKSMGSERRRKGRPRVPEGGKERMKTKTRVGGVSRRSFGRDSRVRPDVTTGDEGRYRVNQYLRLPLTSKQ